jgi:hypothetical protein
VKIIDIMETYEEILSPRSLQVVENDIFENEGDFEAEEENNFLQAREGLEVEAEIKREVEEGEVEMKYRIKEAEVEAQMEGEEERLEIKKKCDTEMEKEINKEIEMENMDGEVKTQQNQTPLQSSLRYDENDSSPSEESDFSSSYEGKDETDKIDEEDSENEKKIRNEYKNRKRKMKIYRRKSKSNANVIDEKNNSKMNDKFTREFVNTKKTYIKKRYEKLEKQKYKLLNAKKNIIENVKLEESKVRKIVKLENRNISYSYNSFDDAYEKPKKDNKKQIKKKKTNSYHKMSNK